MGKTTMQIADERIIEAAFNRIAEDEPLSSVTRSDIQKWLELLRPLIAERLVVASRSGGRTWVGGESVADLHQTIEGFLADGYALEDLILEGLTA